MNKNEMRRVPGFTAEQALEQRASSPYAGLAFRGGRGEGGAAEPAFIKGIPRCWEICEGHICRTYCMD
jgi:hypothetical protein